MHRIMYLLGITLIVVVGIILLFSAAAQAAPFIDEQNDKCVFQIDRANQTASLDADISTSATPWSGFQAFCYWSDIYTPQPEDDYRDLYIQDTGPCLFRDFEGFWYRGTNVINVVNPVGRNTQFVLSCANLQEIGF